MILVNNKIKKIDLLILGAMLLSLITLLPIKVMGVTDESITGAMTAEQYKDKYGALNQAQNDAWNKKYNFRPETNVKEVSDWEGFRSAFEDNDVSKIILKDNIKSTVNGRRYNRNESIEIDGQGHLLEMVNSSLNVDNVTSLSSFTKNFSDVPVFHMHDIQIINNTGYGAVEGNLNTAWAFINGYSQYGSGGLSGGRRGLWQYRIGNILTPYDESKATNNQRVGGRLINAELGQIDIWGYNKVVTGAENFYTGGIRYEPNTYYRGEIAYYNYSTIWFMLNPIAVSANGNRNDLTGSQQFDIGDNSFVYLHNTNTGTGFPAVYEHYNLLRVGENATYNANVPGTAVSFNEKDSSFVAMKGAKVNLLSRRTGAPTMSLVNSNNTNPTGSTIPPTNTSYQIHEDAELYVVGNNTNSNVGVVDFGNTSSTGGKIVLDNPIAFDIRNQASSNFMGRGNNTNIFSITNSDISLWKNATNLGVMPDIDTTDVASFSVIPTSTNGVVTSTEPKLQNGYVRNQFRRISGFNSAPELLWEPVTDADYSQQARVLLGYVPVGGDNPFDENGDPIVQPVYADGDRVAKADLTDTLGNKYTAASQKDGFLHWNKDDHTKKGFQIAGKELSGIPFRENSLGTRYRDGEESKVSVVDVTPPNPAKISHLVTTVSKKMTGTGEPLSKVSITVNDVKQENLKTIVDEQGDWEIDIPTGLLKPNDEVQIFLEDNAPEIISNQEEAIEKGLAYLPKDRIPITNSATGNINPKEKMTYSDAVFEEATKITVSDITPPTPKINKIARALTKDAEGNQIPQTIDPVISPEDWQGNVTKVNNTLSYRIVVQIPGTKDKDIQKVLYNAKLTDKIPDYLSFDPKDVKVWNYKVGDKTDGFPIRYQDNVIGTDGKNEFNMGDIDLISSEATALANPIIEYDDETRMLTIGIGDTSKNVEDKYNKYEYEGSNKYGYLLPGDKVVVEFPTTVTSNAVKKTIENTATISGYSAELISQMPEEYKEISATSNKAINPGGEISGELTLTSAPEKIVFPKTNLIDYNKAVGSELDQPLIVTDTLKTKNWQVTIKLIEQMSIEESGDVYELPNSLYVRYKGNDSFLQLNTPTLVYESDLASESSGKEEFNISDNWGDSTQADGIKMKGSKVPMTGEYKGTVEWALENTQ